MRKMFRYIVFCSCCCCCCLLVAGRVAKCEKLDKYETFNEISDYLIKVESKNKDKVAGFTIGYSVEGRPIRGIRISTGDRSKKASNPAIVIDSGVHAREWIAPVVVMYSLRQLLNDSNRDLISGVDWYVLPMLNPDGYVYSMESPKDRLWRKNRSNSGTSLCTGVDLNRNFDYFWGGEGSSDDPCSDVYRGPSPFSEPEAAAFANFLLSVADHVKAYVTFHSAAQAILYPWGYANTVPPDWQDLEDLANLASAAIMKSSQNRTLYEVGPTTKLVGVGAGGSDDWAKGAVGIKYVYTVELPGLDFPQHGFHAPDDQLDKIANEMFEGVKVFASKVKSLGTVGEEEVGKAL